MLIIFSKQIRSCDVYFLGNGLFIRKQTFSYEWISSFLLLFDTRKWKLCRWSHRVGNRRHTKGFITIDCLSEHEVGRQKMNDRSRRHCATQISFKIHNKFHVVWLGHWAGKIIKLTKRSARCFCSNLSADALHALYSVSIDVFAICVKNNTVHLWVSCETLACRAIEHQSWSVYSKFIFLSQ